MEVVEFCTTSKPHLLTISELSKIPEIATSKLEITDKIRLIGEDTTAIPKISDTAVAEVFDLELVATDSISNTTKDIVVSESTMLEEENSKEIGSAINLLLEWSNWSECAATCGKQIVQNRTNGIITETKICLENIPCDPVWSEWSSCEEINCDTNIGIKKRYRENPCFGNFVCEVFGSLQNETCNGSCEKPLACPVYKRNSV